eukprot:g27237.t1
MFENAIQLPELQDKAQDESSKAKVDHVLVQKIRHILGLVMLRRRKEEVIQLPPKMFHNIWLPSTPMQVNWYKKILYLQHLPMSRDLRALKKLLVRLRGVACHPRCLVTNKVDRDFLISAGVTTQEELSQLFQEDMSEEHYLPILGNFGRLSRWPLALETFRRAELELAARPRTGRRVAATGAALLRGATIGALCRGAQWQRGLGLLEETRQLKLQFDVISCNAVITSVAKGDAWQLAPELLNRMRRDATFPKPNVVSFNATLSAYARGVAWASSMALLEDRTARTDMYTSKVHPDRATLGACVSALEQSRCWQQVLLLLSDSRMVEPDLRAWNASMSCCTRAEAWPHALQLFHKWRERLTPNEISYNTALNAWERGSHWAPVLKLFQEMLHREVPPDVVTFNTTIAALQWERWELGLQHFDLLRHRKLRPNVVTLGTIIGACGRGLQWQRALHFFWQGDRYGDWAPNEVAVVSAMTACKQSGRWLEALQLFQDLGRRSLQQNVVSHSAAIAACAKAGQFEQVELLLQQMHEASVRANAVAFTAALRLPSLSWQRALELFRIMEAQCIETDAFAFHRLVKVCQIDSIWEEAVRAFVRMCEKHEPRVGVPASGRPPAMQSAVLKTHYGVDGLRTHVEESTSFMSMAAGAGLGGAAGGLGVFMLCNAKCPGGVKGAGILGGALNMLNPLTLLSSKDREYDEKEEKDASDEPDPDKKLFKQVNYIEPGLDFDVINRYMQSQVNDAVDRVRSLQSSPVSKDCLGSESTQDFI